MVAFWVPLNIRVPYYKRDPKKDFDNHKYIYIYIYICISISSIGCNMLNTKIQETSGK